MQAPDRRTLDVAVSLVNTDNRALLRSCLTSIPPACEGLAWEVTVVDNASTDGSADMVAGDFPWARLIHNEVRLGFSANHNQVILPLAERHRAEFVLVLNEDTELYPGSVRDLVACARHHPRVGVVGPVIVGTDGSRQPSAFTFPTVKSHLLRALVPSRKPPPAGGECWLNGSCLLVRLDALREVGTLDERYFIFFEDTDLARCLADAGWSSLLCEAATILHHGHQTVSRPALGSAMERQMLRSAYLYFEKHHGRRAAFAVLWLVRAALLARAAKAGLAETILSRPGDTDVSTLLVGLARFDPRQSLPHEHIVGTALEQARLRRDPGTRCAGADSIAEQVGPAT